MQSKAIFLDRDGVINHDPGDYTTSLSTFRLLPGVLDQMLEWHKLGYLLIIVTNQAGIAKGLYTAETLSNIHNYLINQCLIKGFNLTEIYYCPHHPDYGKCLCRKPGSLLVEKALKRFSINASESYFIGDKQRDITCAEGAGVKGILIPLNGSIKGLINN